MPEHIVKAMVEDAQAAGRAGQPMPNFGYLAAMSREQMATLNRAYDQARNHHEGGRVRGWRKQ